MVRVLQDLAHPAQRLLPVGQAARQATGSRPPSGPLSGALPRFAGSAAARATARLSYLDSLVTNYDHLDGLQLLLGRHFSRLRCFAESLLRHKLPDTQPAGMIRILQDLARPVQHFVPAGQFVAGFPPASGGRPALAAPFSGPLPRFTGSAAAPCSGLPGRRERGWGAAGASTGGHPTISEPIFPPRRRGAPSWTRPGASASLRGNSRRPDREALAGAGTVTEFVTNAPRAGARAPAFWGVMSPKWGVISGRHRAKGPPEQEVVSSNLAGPVRNAPPSPSDGGALAKRLLTPRRPASC